jgi:glycosyltransferase involved in cell wall biosynthesis
MMNPPKISIVTPSFNQGEFLEECIDSVLSQNYPDLEYIVMDGGSTDNSVEIIKKYAKHLTYWQSRPDRGQYDAINEGFKKTTGEVMAWLNSDDKYHRNAFFKVGQAFAKYDNVAWLTGRPSIWDRNGALSYVPSFLPSYSRKDFLKRKNAGTFIQQESTFWRRSLWEKAGAHIRTDLVYAGDLELWMRFFRFAQLYSVNALLGGYRKYGDQKAGVHMDRYLDEAKKVRDEEKAVIGAGKYTDLPPAPKPLAISSAEVKELIDADPVAPYLLERLNDTQIMRDAFIVILRSLRLYNAFCFLRGLFGTGAAKNKGE